MKAAMPELNEIANRQSITTAIRVALVVGSLLFAINHGTVVTRQMSRDRWISA